MDLVPNTSLMVHRIAINPHVLKYQEKNQG
jgi:hypothetical protein